MQLSELNAEAGELEDIFIKQMEASELNTLKLPGGECLTIVEKRSVKVPQTREDRQIFFSHLKERGQFDDLITVHSATLNAWYNSEEELATANGVLEFKVPGLNDVNTYKKISYRGI